MRRNPFVAACILVLITTVAGAQQSKGPTIFVDRHICPGEGCSYKGRPKVKKRTAVYANPAAGSSRLFEVPAGSTVTSLDSEVHTVAGRFVVKRNHAAYRSGDVIWVYTYLGEGIFKVWRGGRMRQEDLGFSPWGGSGGKRCEADDKVCWGELDKVLDMTWWLKIKDSRGRTGWIRIDENLEWRGESG
ncbi:MAG TPA: hypothetical protein VIV66_11575 [Pyrinomonadaceae bacterium]